MAGHILIAFAVAVAWLLSLYAKPFGKCWRCRGRGNLKGRRKVCPRCHGMKRGQRLGSRTVHRTVRMVRAELARTRKLREGKP